LLDALMVSSVLVAVAEIGDKTQLATIALGARFDSVFQLVTGTTLGMMAVLIGCGLAGKLPLDRVRRVAAALLATAGIWTLLSRD
jgi:putative Ca2+/H+ antiporter (TMEM165/GDT1 family)